MCFVFLLRFSGGGLLNIRYVFCFSTQIFGGGIIEHKIFVLFFYSDFRGGGLLNIRYVFCFSTQIFGGGIIEHKICVLFFYSDFRGGLLNIRYVFCFSLLKYKIALKSFQREPRVHIL